MASPEDKALRSMNGEGKSHHTRRAFLAAGVGALLGAGTTYIAPKVYDWAMGTSDKLPNRELSWRSAQLRTDQLDFQSFPPDPDAGILPESWHTVGVMKVKANAYDATRLALQEEFGVPLAQAVAFKDDGKVQVGVAEFHGQLQDFLGVNRQETVDNSDATERVIGMRRGPGELYAAIGYYAQDTFIIAPQIENAGFTQISQLEAQFPGAVWV